MADRHDRDELDMLPPPPTAPKMSSSGISPLPASEPQPPPTAALRAQLERQVRDLEGQLEYMGEKHPLRLKLQEQVKALRRLLGEFKTQGKPRR